MTPQEFLAEHQQEMAEDLRRFVEQETPSTDLQRLHDFAAFLADRMRSQGAAVRVIETPEGKRHVRAEWGTAGRPVFLSGHFDTVWPVGTLETMPFRIDDGLAYGPGSFDMKAGLVQGLWAVHALREVLQSDRRVVFLCTSDEEIGSGTSRGAIEEEAAAAAAVLVLEPSHHGALKTARKGVGNFRVEISGRAAHAGNEPEAGASAIEEMAHVILALHSLTDLGTGSTVNVGVVHGGTRSNVVAAEAVGDVDVRFATQAEAGRLETAICGLRPHREGIRVRVTGGINRPPMERTPGTAALYEQAASIAGTMGFHVNEASVGGGSDGNFCSALGVPVLDGLGAIGGGAHAIDEHVVLADMPIRAALTAHLLASI